MDFNWEKTSCDKMKAYNEEVTQKLKFPPNHHWFNIDMKRRAELCKKLYNNSDMVMQFKEQHPWYCGDGSEFYVLHVAFRCSCYESEQEKCIFAKNLSLIKM